MATREQLKKITEARIQSFTGLMQAEDWFWGSYTMAMALECALKAMTCKTLDIDAYPEYPEHPEDFQKSKIVNFFCTHEFEQLLIISGLTKTLKSTEISEIYQSWSDFTKEFTGNWSKLKYDFERQQQFDRIKVERLYKTLMDSSHGLITKIKEKW